MLFQNSWTRLYGEGGYGRMLIKDVRNMQGECDFWTVVDKEGPGPGPGPEPEPTPDIDKIVEALKELIKQLQKILEDLGVLIKRLEEIRSDLIELKSKVKKTRK